MRYGARDNGIAAALRTAGTSFIESKEWKQLRRAVVNTYGRKCMKCGTTPRNPRHTPADYRTLAGAMVETEKMACG
jgi:hypothetical protein